MDRRSLNPIREAMVIGALWRIFRDEKPDVVHGFTIKCAVYGGLAARLALVPGRVSAIAGMGYIFTNDDLRARILRPIVRLLLRVALGGAGSRVILQNPDDAALLMRAAIVRSEDVRLILGSGVDCARFTARPVSRPEGPMRVLMAARLLWDKGVAEYVEAATKLIEEGRPIHFLLAGEPDPGNPASVGLQSVKAWVDEGLIEWLGHVDDMAELLRSVDVFVLPSYREGLPKGLIEAGASGLPLITTDVPGCHEVVTDGEDGLLVPVRNAGALADAIARIQDEPSLASRLGAAARAKVLAEFDERRVIGQTRDVYTEVACPARPK